MKKLMQVFCTACILDLRTVKLSFAAIRRLLEEVLAEELKQK